MRKNGTAGFSLIEVMAAIVILGIAMTAVFSTFLYQQQSYTTQVRVAEMQQNLRDAMEMISRDIRMCTYGIPSNVNIVDNEITLADRPVPQVRQQYLRAGRDLRSLPI